ncbi:hypothetical protein PMAYCL1PPCAC_32182, partial [Pristionchus mayeri]
FTTHHLIHYDKAAQFLRMIRKFVGESHFDRAINKYLRDNAYGNGDAEKVIHYLLDEYDGDRYQLDDILREWLYQPGVAILFAERKEIDEKTHQIMIRQKRMHSTYFDPTLRDDKTRFSIPLFCTIDGDSKTRFRKRSGKSNLSYC